MTPQDFITTNAALIAPPLVPEIKLFLATEVVPLWHATEEELAKNGIPPPYWAFAWAGGQALARYVLDHPDTVHGKRVLDIGSGSGLVGIAAAKAGAAPVLAAAPPDAWLAVRRKEGNRLRAELLAPPLPFGFVRCWRLREDWVTKLAALAFGSTTRGHLLHEGAGCAVVQRRARAHNKR